MIQYSDVVNKVEQAISIKYNNKVYELKQKGYDIIVLSLGEAFFDIPLMDISVLPMAAIYHYVHSRGIIELRKKICDYYLKMYGVKVNPDNEILITAGSKASIHFSIMSLINQSEEVLIPEPAWVSYTEMVKLCYGRPILIPHTKSYKDYEHYLSARTKALIINNPQNPTGYIYSSKELNYLMGMAKANNIFIIGDEAYSDFTNDDKDFTSIGKYDPEFKNTVICNSISKNFGISGWRIGYVISNPDLIFNVLRINQHIITCAPSILQYYMSHYFEDIIKITYPQIKAVIQKRKEIAAFMDSIGLTYLPGNGTFYFFVSTSPSKLSSIKFCDKLLEEYMTSAVPGIGYGESCDKFIRISVGTESVERIHEGLLKIKQVIAKTN